VPTAGTLSAISIPSEVALISSATGEAVGARTIMPRLTQQLPILADFLLVGIFLLVVYGDAPLGPVCGIGRWCLA
jgi:hypothetical protein